MAKESSGRGNTRSRPCGRLEAEPVCGNSGEGWSVGGEVRILWTSSASAYSQRSKLRLVGRSAAQACQGGGIDSHLRFPANRSTTSLHCVLLRVAIGWQFGLPLSPLPLMCLKFQDGWVAEWLKAPVLKTGRRATVSWVRIPPHPPKHIDLPALLFVQHIPINAPQKRPFATVRKMRGRTHS